MQLERLAITRETWGVNKGQFTGAIEFSNQSGKIQLNLNHETGQKLLAVVAECLVDTAKEVATQLTTEVIDSSRLIAPPIE
jgi:hypothetical protein